MRQGLAQALWCHGRRAVLERPCRTMPEHLPQAEHARVEGVGAPDIENPDDVREALRFDHGAPGILFCAPRTLLAETVLAGHFHVTAFAKILFLPMTTVEADPHQALQLIHSDRGDQTSCGSELLQHDPGDMGHRRADYDRVV